MLDNQNIINEEMDERILLNSLKYHAFVFPSTENELENYIASIEASTEKVPEHLSNPLKLVEKKGIVLGFKPDVTKDIQINGKLSMAAREGKQIPDDILKKMAKDRQQAEDESNN